MVFRLIWGLFRLFRRSGRVGIFGFLLGARPARGILHPHRPVGRFHRGLGAGLHGAHKARGAHPPGGGVF